MRESTALIDFETRSTCSLRKSGSWKYSLDPTTEPLCLAYRLPSWTKGRTGLWHPAFPGIGLPAREDDDLNDLMLWIVNGQPVEAHNAWFERGIWTNIMGPRFGWPGVDRAQWRCSAAKAAAHALPRSLDDVGDALDLAVQKDTEGGKLMKKLTKPRKPKKAERALWANKHGAGPCVACKGKGTVRKTPCPSCAGAGSFPGSLNDVPPMPTLYHEKKEWYLALFEYCRQDVLSEEAVSEVVPDLSERELRVYLTDQAMNERGTRLDREAITVALTFIKDEQTRLNAEVEQVTGGAVSKATQRQKILAWCADQGVHMQDTTAETLEWVLKIPDLPAPVFQVLSILSELGKSSTAKYEAMSNWICEDDRAHGLLLYHGASTGRWSGVGIQPQNFPKCSKTFDMDLAWEALEHGERWIIEDMFGSVMGCLAQALRGAIVASPGKKLYVADYAAIEARMLLWLAEDEDALAVFRRGEDIYCDMASSIYHRPITKKDEKERGMGKVAILGLGYQMGWTKFIDTCATYGITIDEGFSRQVVDAYREKYRRVKELWREQEDRAIQAVRNPGYEIPTGRVAWEMDGRFLYCTLPSGRRLAYPEAEVRRVQSSWGWRDQLTFMGVNPLNHQWDRQHTYGGMLVENITQAASRDLIAEAVLRCEVSGKYTPILTIHDELIAEGDPGHPLKEFEELVATLPSWASGCPVKAEGFVAERYRK